MGNKQTLDLVQMVKAMSEDEKFVVASSIPTEILLDTLRVRFSEMENKLSSISSLISVE